MASTTGIETWAVDLAEVGTIYPFPGTETLLVVIALVLWIAWHVVQIAGERRAIARKVRRHGDAQNVARAVEKHGN